MVAVANSPRYRLYQLRFVILVETYFFRLQIIGDIIVKMTMGSLSLCTDQSGPDCYEHLLAFSLFFCRHQPVLARLANWEAITSVCNVLTCWSIFFIVTWSIAVIIVIWWSQKRAVIILSFSLLISHALPGNLTIMQLVLLQSTRYYF